MRRYAGHGISIHYALASGRPPLEIASRMNIVLAGRELFADSPFDEASLLQMFDAAGLEPTFRVRKLLATLHVQKLADELSVPASSFIQMQRASERISPRIHRAEADARYWATLWLTMSISKNTQLDSPKSSYRTSFASNGLTRPPTSLSAVGG
jgi:hypothetical protein